MTTGEAPRTEAEAYKCAHPDGAIRSMAPSFPDQWSCTACGQRFMPVNEAAAAPPEPPRPDLVTWIEQEIRQHVESDVPRCPKCGVDIHLGYLHECAASSGESGTPTPLPIRGRVAPESRMNDLGIDTTGWVRCGHPGCTWLLDPCSPGCPEHSDPPSFIADPDDPASIEEGKRIARGSPGEDR